MCGFILIVDKNKNLLPINEHLLTHRGPDFSSEISTDWFKTRHWRLSIQDLSENSNQPFDYDNKTLVYNGELYDFETIGLARFKKTFQSDTQLLFHSLREKDFAHLKFASGFYAFAFVDKNRRDIFACRDPFGKKPLYYYMDERFFILSSEEQAICQELEKYSVKVGIKHDAIVEYLQFKDLYFGNTFYEGIYEVPPGCEINLEYDNWKLDTQNSWDFYYKNKPFYKSLSSLDADKLSKNSVEEKIFESISKRFVSDVPMNIALSGGVDSTLVTVAAARLNLEKKIKSALCVSSSLRPSEALKSEQTADFFNLDFHKIDFETIDFQSYLVKCIKSQGGPISHPHALAYFLLTEKGDLSEKILLTGEGADELFYGYDHYKENYDCFAFRKHIDLNDYFDHPNIGKINYNYNSFLNDCLHDNRNDLRDLDVKTHLLSLLRRNDRISMRNSVEIRSAFLDPELFFYVGLKHLKKNLVKGKSILVSIIKHYYDGFKADQKKIGFYVPFDDWFFRAYAERSDTQDYITVALSYLESSHQLYLKDGKEIKGKLAWILLNIGIFLDIDKGGLN